MTYGELKLRLTQMFPGVSLDLIEGWVSDRYAEILGELPWQRQNVTGVLQTVAPYVTGTLTLTSGSSAVTGSGTTFTTAMTGRALRVTGRDEIYEFTYASGTTGTLDRPYEGPNVVGASYRIAQHVYLMPADCRMLEDSAFSPLTRLQHDTGEITGKPDIWASYMDDSSTPPRMQVKVYPIPDAVYGIPFTYQTEIAVPGASSTTLLPWIQPTALVEGVVAKIKRHLRDYAGAQIASADAGAALQNMRTSEAQGMPQMTMQLPSYYTSHRAKRWSR